MKISILVDNPDSWIFPYAEKAVKELSRGHEVLLLREAEEISEGDCAFFLSCGKLVKDHILKRNKHNLVIHESRLPEGKGWSPLTWQILEGKNEIPITLFEAEKKVDNGKIYLQENMYFEGHELVDELRQKQGEKTIELIKKFCGAYPVMAGKAQSGRESFYPKRIAEDSELDIDKTIVGQFNLLRVADNERYPAFFHHLGHKYIVKIFKDDK